MNHWNYSDLKHDYQFFLGTELSQLFFEWILDFFRRLFYASLIFCIPPFLVVISIFACSFFFFISKFLNKLRVLNDKEDIWRIPIKYVSIFTETFGKILHDHELIGLENIPNEGPALLVYYHALLPVDYYYVHAKVFLYKNRRIKIVGDRFLFLIPGFRSILEAFEVTPGSVENCKNILNDGNLISISPGGLKEAIYSDENYQVIWGKRSGFAKIAQAAKVPIIPMFTKNSREAFRCFPFFKIFSQKLYEKTRLPLVPIYGIFPVKLRTYIGEPIEYDETRTPEELKKVTKEKLEDLIKKHQCIPGSISQAVLDRLIS